ncbi:alpha-amylase family glycosyl hydrolase [Zobellia galactanivorans]|uniref:Cyclomaltodextrinase, family GH13 n=1 Tax=Zobellia galactanivorans (strain DSM 12802 / CCUG 47099 / CIP 106680 / NCIMB 13871 / Dsij) TaxID=63186 RepID=G0LAZ4_ZOBGA|nr:alpha-amylase family glycosyl hydrolase [Zobellia galactanivorans]CAZ95681.1 Cyclomaltodextrinase, family GH13 [Zobellia galactanivorans]
MDCAIFYHIYPLGLLGADRSNNFTAAPVNRFSELHIWLEHMVDLGCNALYIGPVFESSTHGYDTRDYYKVDRRLGDDTALIAFVEKAHELGIQVVLDGVFNHVGRDFFAFKDLQEWGKHSKYTEWFSNVNFRKRSPLKDPFTYDTWAGHYELVKLNLANKEVRDYLFGAVKKWIDTYKIDGLRLDTADVLDFDFMKELALFCKRENPNFWLMGEVVHGDYNRWVNPFMLDSVTNYDYHTPIYESFNLKDFGKISETVEEDFGPKGVYKNRALYSFVDNHDVDRAASSLKKPEHLFPLYLLLFTLPGIPAIYYGSEWGFEGRKSLHSDELLRPSVKRNDLGKLAKHPKLLGAIKQFIVARKSSEALVKGSYQTLLVTGQYYAFSRKSDNKTVVVVVNASNRSARIHIPFKEPSAMVLTDLLSPEYSLTSDKTGLYVEVPPCWGRILCH